jgi:molybdate transport system ATP-binding protein
MINDPAELDPNRLAAVLYGPADDADNLLAEFAQDLLRNGTRIGGVVQYNLRDADGKKSGMEVLDLAQGHTISICQSLGSGSMACKLDAAGLAEAAVAVQRAISNRVDLIVVNKFSKQEASGAGLRDELAHAIMSGIPVLTAVPEKCIEDWKIFTGDHGTTLVASREAIDGWWRELNSRTGRLQDPRSTAPQLLADHHVR